LDEKIEEKREALNNLNLLFDAQNESYTKINREMEDMNKKLEEKDELINEC
jgi:Skp family chaperone for outer membrane proteins